MSIHDRTMSTRDRIIEHADGAPEPERCWVWPINFFGYGHINGGAPVHRVAYEVFVGPIPDGLEIDHLCRNRACCNPAHLEPVTHRENVLRGTSPAAHHARKSACPKCGGSYKTFTRRNGEAYRYCPHCRRAVDRARTARYEARKRAATSPTNPVSPLPAFEARREGAYASRDRHGDIDPGVADVRPSGAAGVPDEHRVALEVGPRDHRHGGQAGRVGADHAVAGGGDHGSCDGDAFRRFRVQQGVDAGGSCSDGSGLRERRLADRYVGSRALAGSPGALVAA